MQPGMTELTGFQRDLLIIIAGEGGLSGLSIKDILEEYYSSEIHHGRLYPNLDKLVDQGLIKKGEHDKRTNKYNITDKGMQVIRSHKDWQSEKIEQVTV